MGGVVSKPSGSPEVLPQLEEKSCLGYMAFRNEVFDPWILGSYNGKLVRLKKKNLL